MQSFRVCRDNTYFFQGLLLVLQLVVVLDGGCEVHGNTGLHQ